MVRITVNDALTINDAAAIRDFRIPKQKITSIVEFNMLLKHKFRIF